MYYHIHTAFASSYRNNESIGVICTEDTVSCPRHLWKWPILSPLLCIRIICETYSENSMHKELYTRVYMYNLDDVKPMNEMLLVFTVASRHCLPILADEIYSDMVSVRVWPSGTPARHIFQHSDSRGCAAFGGICPGSGGWVDQHLGD